METLVILLIVLIISIPIVRYFVYDKKQRIKRILNSTTSKQIGDVKDFEYVQIKGIVENTSYLIRSPLSKKECVYYAVQVQQLVHRGKSHSWETIIEEEYCGNFVIKDGSHYAKLIPGNTLSFLEKDTEFSSGLLNNATDNLNDFLRDHAVMSTGFLGFNKSLRYYESIVEEGDTVLLAGVGEWKKANELDLPEKYGLILSMSASSKRPMVFTDKAKLMRYFIMNKQMRHFSVK